MLLVCANGYAQKVDFKEIKLKPDSHFYTTNKATIFYPVLESQNKKSDKSINAQILEKISGGNAESLSAKMFLIREIKNSGLTRLSYKITYNKNGILSMNIYQEGCGAYCSSWYTYFNFDLKTGNKITISDLLEDERVDSFRQIVSGEKAVAITKYKAEEKSNLEHNIIDSTTYDWAREQVDSNCSIIADIENFSLSDHGIEIIDNCEFPHAIKSLEPAYEFTYGLKCLSPFLKARYRKILSTDRKTINK
jgi:hypothetical protein